MKENPYADFGTIITEDRFVGREGELRTIASRIFGERNFGSIAVVGLPRIGKTSLVSEAIRRAEALPIGRPLDRGPLERGRARLGGRAVQDPDRGAGRRGSVPRSRKRARERSGDRRPSHLRRSTSSGSGQCFGRYAGRTFVQCGSWTNSTQAAGCSRTRRSSFTGCASCAPTRSSSGVIVAKRRLQDVARLAGRESDYWANVLMTLALKPLSDAEIDDFFSRLDANGVSLGEAERAEVLAVCGGHPYLLDAFGYHAWEHVERGGEVSVGWVEKECATLAREYFEQVSTILSETVISDGTMLSKAVQVLVGPQWDVTAQDVDALRELGVLLSDGEGGLRGFSRSFQDHLRVVERGIDLWPLWRETEQALREYLDRGLNDSFGPDWPEDLGKARPKFQEKIAHWREEREKESRRFGDRAESSLLAYTYPMQLYELMAVDWARLGQPLLGADRAGWDKKFGVLAKVRTPVAHSREGVVG